MLASTNTRVSSPRCAGPSGAASSTARRCSARSLSWVTDCSSGSTSTVPETPSRANSVPDSTSRIPGQRTTAGMPIWAARIAVWLVGPPAAVTRPRTSSGSRVAVSAGARSSATRMTGESKAGTPGSGSPCRTARARSRTLCRSVTRSARYPPAAVSWAQKSSMAPHRAWAGPSPSSRWVRTELVRPGSRAIMAVAMSTPMADGSASRARASRRSATLLSAAVTLATSSSVSPLGSRAGRPGAGSTSSAGAWPIPAETPRPEKVFMMIRRSESRGRCTGWQERRQRPRPRP